MGPPGRWDLSDDRIQCPWCHACRHIGGATLRNTTGFAYVVCSSCHNRSRSLNWRCSCTSRWFRCNLHSQLLPHRVSNHARRRRYHSLLKQSRSTHSANAGSQQRRPQPHLHDATLPPDNRRTLITDSRDHTNLPATDSQPPFAHPPPRPES